MHRRSILPLVLILVFGNLLSVPLSGVAQEPELPSGYIGTWAGTGYQTDADGNADGEWTITLTLTGGPIGIIVGTVNYPGLGCSGELTYLGPDHPTHGQGIMLSEDITTGEGACIDGGTFLLSFGSSSDLYFYWESPDSTSFASGDLPRVKEDTASSEAIENDDADGTGTLTLSSGVCYGSEDEPVTANYVVIYPDSGAFELPGGCRSSASRAGYSFTITAADSNGSTATAITDENGTFDLDLVAGEYTVTEDASGLSTIVTVTTGSSVTVALMYYAPSGSSVDVTLNAGGNNGTENWQQTTWEGLTISYPPDHTFYPSGNAAAGERASAALQPDDCAGTGMDCPSLGFRLYANDEGLSAREWAANWNGLIARNFRDITIAGQAGVAFETGNPDEYPGETSTFIVPVGTEILEISGVGYQDFVEQIVASITITQTTIVYFALGDSVASGHGLMDDQTPCRRSTRAYPYKVKESLEQQGYVVIFPSENHLACSGAKTQASVNPEPNKLFANQVQEVVLALRDIPSDQLVLVSITIGANDFGWLSPIDGLPRFQGFNPFESPDSYDRWLDGRASLVYTQLRYAVEKLLRFDNVRIVATSYGNPINLSSTILRRAGGQCNLLGTLSCYERVERFIMRLEEGVILDTYVAVGRPRDQMRLTGTLREEFRDHEGPGGELGALCGYAPPGIDETWIQYPGDPASNSIVVNGVVLGGDCFHPNEKGANEYAEAVVEAALPILILPDS